MHKKLPWSDKKYDEGSWLARLHVSARPIPLSEYIPDIPPALEEIVMKVLSKEPSARYRTADQLGRVLQKFGAEPILPPLPSAAAPKINPGSERLPQTGSAPVSTRSAPTQLVPEEAVEQPAPGDIDWISVGLGLLAVLAVGGLIPFWMMVLSSQS